VEDGGTVAERDEVYLRKAEESLRGAETALLARRYNNCANRGVPFNRDSIYLGP
jgi:hypothetical protein